MSALAPVAGTQMACTFSAGLAAPVPGAGGFGPSNVLFSRGHDDYAVASLDIERDGAGVRIVDHRCGQVGMQLIKVTGSSSRVLCATITRPCPSG